MTFRKRILLPCVAALVPAVAAFPADARVAAKVAEVSAVSARGPFAPTWDSLARFQTPAWYADGKFGIFIHWGVYSVPAFGNEWYPRNMYKKDEREFAHHVATFGPQARFGYKDFIPQFKAEKFDARRWASLFKAAGARYVVPVAEHHDGFPMYDCSLTEWSAAKMGLEAVALANNAAARAKAWFNRVRITEILTTWRLGSVTAPARIALDQALTAPGYRPTLTVG